MRAVLIQQITKKREVVNHHKNQEKVVDLANLKQASNILESLNEEAVQKEKKQKEKFKEAWKEQKAERDKVTKQAKVFWQVTLIVK